MYYRSYCSTTCLAPESLRSDRCCSSVSLHTNINVLPVANEITTTNSQISVYLSVCVYFWLRHVCPTSPGQKQCTIYGIRCHLGCRRCGVGVRPLCRVKLQDQSVYAAGFNCATQDRRREGRRNFPRQAHPKLTPHPACLALRSLTISHPQPCLELSMALPGWQTESSSHIQTWVQIQFKIILNTFKILRLTELARLNR